MEHIESRLKHHDSEIVDLKKGQDLIFGKLDQLTGVVSQIATSLTEIKAQRGPGFKDVLDIGSRVVMLAAAAIGGIIALAVYASRPDMAEIRTELAIAKVHREYMERDLARVNGGLNWKVTGTGLQLFARPLVGAPPG